MREYNQESIKMNETKQEIKLDCDFDNNCNCLLCIRHREAWIDE